MSITVENVSCFEAARDAAGIREAGHSDVLSDLPTGRTSCPSWQQARAERRNQRRKKYPQPKATTQNLNEGEVSGPGDYCGRTTRCGSKD